MGDNKYQDIISLENLYESWSKFVSNKKYKRDVAEFALNLSENIFGLHEELKNMSYKHGEYVAFNISDPKPRNIHKATVRDRLLHHAIYRQLYPLFDKTFIYDSYSCRLNKGTHKALDRFRYFARKVSNNDTKTVWVLKCDVRKFFASIDQATLTKIVKKYISDKNVIWLLNQIISSFCSTKEGVGLPVQTGLPLGNLTSQLLVNVYMNEFDQFMKHEIKAKYYIRYADDFVIMSQDKAWLEETLKQIKEFLLTKLKLNLHPDKVSIKTLASGIDFLGWVNFIDHRVLRTSTKKRMVKSLVQSSGKEESLQSYLGMLSHGNTGKIQHDIISPWKKTKSL
ncbi:MAG: reverse transcriptase/maturase family protein [Candidatus Paceibacterota bacterium]|jgi:retron-type reverse transcriptase